MQIWFIFSLVFSLVVAYFAVLNSNLVTITFLGVNYELAQSAVILVSAVFGAAIATFLGSFSRIRSNLKTRELTSNLRNSEKKIEGLNASLRTCQQKASVAASENVKPTNN